MNLISNEVSRQPFEIVDIMVMPESAIWRGSVEYMFWRATLSFIIFLKEVFIFLNLIFLITYIFISFIMILIIFLVSLNFNKG